MRVLHLCQLMQAMVLLVILDHPSNQRCVRHLHYQEAGRLDRRQLNRLGPEVGRAAATYAWRKVELTRGNRG